MKKLFASCLVFAALTGCAAAPLPVVAKPPCVVMPPPPVGTRRLVLLAPPKMIDREKDIGALIVKPSTFIGFTDWIIEVSAWADATYEACKDPAAPSAPPVFPMPKQHRQDEDEDEK